MDRKKLRELFPAELAGFVPLIRRIKKEHRLRREAQVFGNAIDNDLEALSDGKEKQILLMYRYAPGNDDVNDGDLP